jgi:hypothetical protein
MNRCFVAVSKTKLYFIISNGECRELSLGTDINTSIKEIETSCTFEESNVFCIGENSNENCKLSLIKLKYVVDTNPYTKIILDNLSNLITTNFLSKDSRINTVINDHIKTMHNSSSLIGEMNAMLHKLQGESIMQQTGFSENNRISYIVLDFPNTGSDFSFVQTDDNSTNIYGRINSNTINANPGFITSSKRNSNSITYYDTVYDEDGKLILSTNKLTYSLCRVSDKLSRLTVNIPSTGTYYVDNIAGWSCGNRTGSSLKRKNLDGGYLSGILENCTTKYQLVLNKYYFDIKNILNVCAQLTSAPLKIYSNKNEFDIRHYGMYDSPIIAPLNMNNLTPELTYNISNSDNGEVVLGFSIFGGDAMQINILIENNGN